MITLKQRISLAWRVLVYKPGNLMAHAENELGAGCDIELKEILLVFSSQGHSGMSASITTSLVEKLMRFEPIGPLTGEPDEWIHHGNGMYQNRRCGHVFKQPDRFDGQAYDLDGIVWENELGHFTNSASMVPITFPYTPRTEYRKQVVTAA